MSGQATAGKAAGLSIASWTAALLTASNAMLIAKADAQPTPCTCELSCALLVYFAVHA